MSNRRPFRWILLLIVLGAFPILFWGAERIHFRYWEKFLRGPFTGMPYTTQVASPPSGVLALPGNNSLEVFEIQDELWPVLLLRDAAGSVKWSYLLKPELRYSDGKVEHPSVNNFRFKKLRSSRESYKVVISCEWPRGGAEDGVVYLGKDLSFKGFSLGW